MPRIATECHGLPLISTLEAAQVLLPSTALPVDAELVFRLSIEDRFGRHSVESITPPGAALVVTSQAPLPLVTIAAPPLLTVPFDAPLRLHGRATLPSCFPAAHAPAAALSLLWSLVGVEGEAVRPGWGRAGALNSSIVPRNR